MKAKTKLTGALASAFVALSLLATPALAQSQPQAQQSQQQRTISAEDAFTLVKQNAEKGDGAAMLTLGTFYEQGIGVSRNFVSAMEWYKKAADANVPEGYYNLGVCYEIGMGNAGDMKKALASFQKSAQLGLPQAMQKLASMYFSGEGVGQSNKRGLEWLSKAADANSADAANTLGVVYSQGLLDQTKDEKKAFSYFTKAADLGHLEAIKNLAVIHKDGLGRKKDPAEALKWYLIAQKGGYQAADLDLILTELRGALKAPEVKKAEEAADRWIEDFRKKNQPAE
ncbi:sel1 repeat family protein [Phaeovibrio sulfidiphilus]|uniref:Sel1 repeat family protein n=1 Tax=Phaeovibrio sulfidiphilus TaxID=1220600 RepID=A0A8J7CPV7_9PROT|nr:sel1 repeat family protein [Phaeovibrio sulfidiphilus]